MHIASIGKILAYTPIPEANCGAEGLAVRFPHDR
jgi:hypothetical protein